jgi:hypothetical protein
LACCCSWLDVSVPNCQEGHHHEIKTLVELEKLDIFDPIFLSLFEFLLVLNICKDST